MNVSTHIDVSKTVLEALAWKGDTNLAAKNAGYPDEVRAVLVDGVGAHLLGHNLASLNHFVVPYGGGKFGGYCWKTDRSIPNLDITNRKVGGDPKAWGFPIIAPFDEREPFVRLIRDLIASGSSIQADEITYTSAAAMAEWCWNTYLVWAKDSGSSKKQEALDTLVGWMLHLGVQDPSVPHHGLGIMLRGHSAFEGDVDDEWRRMKGSGEVDKLLKTMVVADNTAGTPRALAEELATASASVGYKRLGWYRCAYRRGWNKQVRTCVLRGLLGSVRLVKACQREAV